MDEFFALITVIYLLSCSTFSGINANSNIELLEKKKPEGSRPFEGHKVVRAFPATKKEADFINSLEFDPNIEVDFWAKTRNIDIHVGPEDYEKLAALLKQSKIAFNILNDNLQNSLDEEQRGHYRVSHGWHGDYHTCEQIYQKINNLAQQHNKWAKLLKIGKSYEKRDILGLEITGKNTIPNKQKIVLICGQHAREWIAPATCIFMMDKMLEKYETDANTTAMIDRFNWVIFPLLNPDGYAYTWKSTGYTHRLWRKNRQPNLNSTCNGTDLNRNWAFKWAGRRSSGEPCSDNYRGSAPFSAPEARVMSEYLKANREKIFSFIDIHSYRQLWMYPWSYTDDVQAKDKDELHRVSLLSVESLRRQYNTDFKTGPAGIIIYEAAGSGIDWSYGEIKIKYAFVLELRDKGAHGFLLPKEQIIPTGEETLAALQTLAMAMKDYCQKSTNYFRKTNDAGSQIQLWQD